LRRRIAAGLAGAPKYIGSDVPRASEVAGFVCRTTASIAAFIEHGYQESLALVEQHKTVVVAIAQALIDHPKRTLDGAEIDAVIVPAGRESRSRRTSPGRMGQGAGKRCGLHRTIGN
jgi:hypothetical protein